MGLMPTGGHQRALPCLICLAEDGRKTVGSLGKTAPVLVPVATAAISVGLELKGRSPTVLLRPCRKQDSSAPGGGTARSISLDEDLACVPGVGGVPLPPPKKLVSCVSSDLRPRLVSVFRFPGRAT